MKYEYKLVRYERSLMFSLTLDEDAITQQINLMATQGWEVVSFTAQTDWGREKSALVLFKKEKIPGNYP